MTEIATAPTACEAPTRPVRVIWHEVACPAAHQLDATELQVGKLLEAADAIVALGLPAAGFHTLALDECSVGTHPAKPHALTVSSGGESWALTVAAHLDPNVLLDALARGSGDERARASIRGMAPPLPAGSRALRGGARARQRTR